MNASQHNGCIFGERQVEKGVRSVALQSTGVYWMPVFEVLEQQGLKVYLVNAQHTKSVPGRNGCLLRVTARGRLSLFDSS
jgi:transposase